MPIKVILEGPSIGSDNAQIFDFDARLLFRVVSQLRSAARIPASSVTALLTDDFVGSVERHYCPYPGEMPTPGWFSSERLGGKAGAKCLDQTGDSSRVTIVFDSEPWEHAEDPGLRAEAIATVSHELVHVVLDRGRHACGAMDGVILPSVTGPERARSISRIVADEYRADAISDAMVAATVTTGEERTPARGLVWQLRQDDYVIAVQTVLAEAHPGWPDLVDSYRDWKIPLEEMWGQLSRSTEQVLTILAHAQAHADSGDDGEILDRPDIAATPAASLYLQPFRRFLDEVRRRPLLPRIGAFAEVERELVAIGEEAILEIWGLLGLTMAEHPDRTWDCLVGEPARFPR